MNCSRMWTMGVFLVAGVLVLSCGSSRRGAPLAPPIPLSDSTLAQGERVFMRFCNGCHPGGRGGLGPGINNKPLPGFLIRFQVRNGLGAMPAFGDDVIPDAEMHALVVYLKALRAYRE